MEVKPGYKKTEIGVIPEDWNVGILRHFLRQDATYGIVKAGAFQKGGVPMLRGGDIIDGRVADDQPFITPEKSLEYSRTVLQRDDVVIALVGYPGESAVVPSRLVGANISRAVGLLRVGRKLNPRYLVCFLNSPSGREEFLRPSAGSAQIVVNLAALNKLQLPVPHLSEQRAIAEALSDVETSIAALLRLITKKRDLRQGVMQRLLTGQTRLPGFARPWQEMRLSQLAIVRSQKITGSALPKGTLCVELDQIDSGSGQLIATGTASSTSVKNRFEVGDVLFGRLRAYLRKFWLADRSGVCSTEIWPLTPVEGVSTSSFILYTVQRSEFIDAATQSYGTHMPRSDWGVVKNFKVLTPSPDEQVAIAAVLSDMDAEISALCARLDKTRTIKQAMMQALLTGHVRLPVKRDPIPESGEAVHG